MSATNTSGYQPVDVKVLIKPTAVEAKTAGGIIIPDTTKDKQKFAVMAGVLIARGPNAFAEWGQRDDIPEGIGVQFAQYAGARVKGRDGQDYILMNDEDVMLIEEANG